MTPLESRVSAIFHSFPSHFSLKASLHSWVMSASLALAAQMLRTKLSPARCHPEAYSDAMKGQHHPASRKPRYKQSVEQHVSSHKPYLQAKAGTASMRDRTRSRHAPGPSCSTDHSGIKRLLVASVMMLVCSGHARNCKSHPYS